VLENVLDPVGRSAPPGIQRALDEIVPGAALVYLGQGHWQLIRPAPKNDDRLRSARRALATVAARRPSRSEGEWARRVRRNRLGVEGYLLWPKVFRFDGDPDGSVVHEFRRGMYYVRHGIEGRDLLDHLEREEEDAKAKARAALGDPAMAREATRAARNPVTFTVNGLKRTA